MVPGGQRVHLAVRHPIKCLLYMLLNHLLELYTELFTGMGELEHLNRSYLVYGKKYYCQI